MKIRHIIAGVLSAVGILLLIGAVGNGDYYGYLTMWDFVKIGAGVVMIGIAIPIGNAKTKRDGGGENG